MAEVASAYVSILPSARGFGRQLDSQVGGELDSAGKRAGSRLGNALKTGALLGLAGLGAAAGKLLGDSISAASDAQQSVGGVEAVFGKYADTVIKDSQRAANALGLSATAYNELVTVSGALLKNKGLADYATQSRNLIKIGADLSATFGGDAKQAVEALNAAMRGESDPIERYGISLNETAVNSVLAAKGQDKLKGAALDQAKAQARLQLITQQAADAQGAFRRESDTLAGQQQRLGANVDNLKAKIGAGLLPAVTDITSKLVTFVKGMQNGTGAGGDFADGLAKAKTLLVETAGFIKRNADVIVPLAAGFLGAAAAIKTVTLVTKAWAAAQLALNVVMAANPITLVIVAIAALAAGFVIAYKRSETFRSIVDKAFSAIKVAGAALATGLDLAFEGIKKGFDAVGKAGTFLWNKALQPAFKFIVGGIASILDLWAAMLSTLAKVPGFGWAEKAAEAMGKAADKARDVADGIKKIPSQKNVNVTVAYKYTGLRNGSGPTRGRGGDPFDVLPRTTGRGAVTNQSSFNDVLKDYGKAGQRLMDRIEAGIKSSKPKVVKAAQDAFDSLKAKLEQKRDDLRSTLDGFRDEFNGIRDSVASAFTGGLFNVSAVVDEAGTVTKTIGQSFIDGLLTKRTELQGLLSSFNILKGWGVDPAFLTQLFASGQGALITELADMGKQGAVDTANLFGEVTNLGNQLGTAVASNDPVAAKLDETNALLAEMNRALSYLGSDVADEINKAANRAQRNKKNRGRK